LVMSQMLGRGESRPWSARWPVSSLGAMLIAAVVGIGIFTYCNIEMWTPLQQWYWVQYLNTKSFPTARSDYKLLTTVDAHGKQLMAVDADVVPGPMQGWPRFPFTLTPKARGGSGQAEDGHCALHECTNEPDAFAADL
jgi:hypothetical protein